MCPLPEGAWSCFFVRRRMTAHDRGRLDLSIAGTGDFPFWDMISGTYVNPRVWEERAGFYDGASERMGDLLLLRDVNADAPRPLPRVSSVPE